MNTIINFSEWLNENRSLLKPPVGNKQIWADTEFMVTVVGGPNARKDWHVDPGEEFFYQLEGDMTLRTIQNGTITEVKIKQGDMFLLPSGVPHSPQRVANTVGMVIERKRNADEKDGLQWYCEHCGALLYEDFFHLTDLTTQLQPVFEKFYASTLLRTCKKCGTVLEPPAMYQTK